jgi:hypothetical protein
MEHWSSGIIIRSDGFLLFAFCSLLSARAFSLALHKF